MNEDNSEKITEFYNNYHNKILLYLKSICRDADIAEDIAQEAFIRVQKSFHTFNPARGTFFSWVKIIARNLCIRNLQKHSRFEIDTDKTDLTADTRTGHEDDFIKNSLKNEIKTAIECLPEPEKSIVYYKYSYNLTLDEIASRVGVSRRTISRKYLSALNLMKEQLQKMDVISGN